MPASRDSLLAARHVAVLAGLGVALAGGTFWWGSAHDVRPRSFLGADIALGMCFVVAGAAAWRARPRSRTGLLMLVLGLVMLIANPYGFEPAPGAPGAALVKFVSEPFYWLEFAVAGHLFLSYPSGRLRRASPEFVLVVACYATVVLTTVAVAVSSLGSGCAAGCGVVRVAATTTWIGFAVLAVVILVHRVVRSPPRRRRQEAFALAAAGSSTALFAAVFAATLFAGGDPAGKDTVAAMHTWMAWTAVVAVPLAFFLGLLQERLAFASVGALVRRLGNVSADAVETALAETLHDPTLRVVFPVGDGLLDVSGHRYDPPGGSASARTPVGDPPTAVLIHDPYLTEDRALLDAAAAAAGLALDNARLNAEVRAQLEDVRASRQRIATAADAERQRLERDLHDGAQQRLLGIGFLLGALRNRLDTPADRQLVGELERDLRGVIGELRDIAQGIRPAVLTDQGLGPALAALARRAGICVSLDASLKRRIDPVVEATAYHVVGEALRNIAGHSEDATVCVSATDEAGRLTVRIVDDVADGPADAGLRDLADRVNAVGGTWEVVRPAGHGRAITASLPYGQGISPAEG